MASITDDREESDGDEMYDDSWESNKSSSPYHTSDGSDTDNSSVDMVSITDDREESDGDEMYDNSWESNKSSSPNHTSDGSDTDNSSVEMASITDDREESDGDEMYDDSWESNKSSSPNHTSDGSDTDNSSVDMASITDDREESDGDEMYDDSWESNKSSSPNHTSDGSDTDNSSVDMASITDDREESDGDEMYHNSWESNKSSSPNHTSDGSDTDNSSGLDGEECERRRNEFIKKLAEMERQFAVLREQLYREKIAQIKQKLKEVHQGVAKEYLQPLEELQENTRIRIEVARIRKKLRMESIENCFKAEEQAARQNFENEKKLLFDSMKEELEEKILRLEEDRNSVDFHSDLFFHPKKTARSHGSGKGRGSWRKGIKPEPGRRKPVTVTGPYIVYMLSDEEILEDVTAIKKALARKQSTDSKPFH